MQLTIEIDNPEDVVLLRAILARFQIRIVSEEQPSESPLFWLDQLAAQGGVKTIDDPSAWQREMRQDNQLPSGVVQA